MIVTAVFIVIVDLCRFQALHCPHFIGCQDRQLVKHRLNHYGDIIEVVFCFGRKPGRPIDPVPLRVPLFAVLILRTAICSPSSFSHYDDILTSQTQANARAGCREVNQKKKPGRLACSGEDGRPGHAGECGTGSSSDHNSRRDGKTRPSRALRQDGRESQRMQTLIADLSIGCRVRKARPPWLGSDGDRACQYEE